MKCCMVKRQANALSFLPLIFIALASIALAVMALFMFTIYLSVVILIVGAAIIVYLTPSILNSEYEYSLEGDSFSIAIIKNNSSRKELFSCEMDYLVSCTPFDERDTYTKTKMNISAYAKDTPLYYAIFTQEDQTVSITFSPSEEFMKSMRLIAPLKVKLI